MSISCSNFDNKEYEMVKQFGKSYLVGFASNIWSPRSIINFHVQMN